MKKNKLKNIIFYLIIFLIPTNLAKHFLKDWSFVKGILVDYYIPAIYLTDILIFTLFLFFLKNLIKKRLKRKTYSFLNLKYKNKKMLFLILIVLLLQTTLNLVFSKNAFITSFKIIKLAEFTFLFFWIRKNKTLLNKKTVLKTISLAVIFQALLSLGQWFNQSFLFGYPFLGEQPITPESLGVKLINFFGTLKLAPYGTLPHPNVLGGFLSLSLIFLVLNITTTVKNQSLKNLNLSFNKNPLFLITFLAGTVSLLLTFSLPAILSLFLSLSFFLLTFKSNNKNNTKDYKNKLCQHKFYKNKTKQIGILILLTTFVLTALSFNFINPNSIKRRLNLNKIALNMFKDNSITGVGLGNFIAKMEDYGTIEANYRFLQPVHNIYLLILSETGVLGILAVSLLILLKIKKETGNLPFLIILTNIFFLGLFDHYFLTIQQGMLTAVILLGLTSSTASTASTSASSASRKSA